MNFKKLLSSAIVGLSMMALAGTASAAYITSDINIYGASAEFNFWKANGGAFLSNNHCSNIQYALADSKDLIIKGTCLQSSSDSTGTTRFLRVSSKASYDGILAVTGNSAGTANGRVTTCDVSGNSASYYKRPMADDTTCSWGSLAAPGACSATLACETVTVGASDTDCSCFSQKSQGHKLGPLGGTSPYGMSMVGLPCPGTSFPVCTPLIVPFTFYVNNTVKKNGVTISNISYDNLQLIFSGVVFDWSDIVDVDGVAYAAQTLVACMRHAGSGTEASLEAYLMASPNCSHYNYLSWQEQTGGPTVYFNDGSGDEMNCVNGSGAWTGKGAIGFADADQSLATYPNTVQLSVGGNPSVLSGANIKAAIQEGSYNFYGQQHLYGVAPTDPLCTFFTSDLIAATSPWSLSSDMTYVRNNTCCSWGQSFP